MSNKLMVLVYLHVIGVSQCSSWSTDVSADSSLTVSTSTATFHGKRVDIKPYLLPDYHGRVVAYTRIPYAEPPIGDLRFRRPVPLIVEGDFDATRKSVACPQNPVPKIDIGLEVSEDCLYLDIFAPEPKVLIYTKSWFYVPFRPLTS